MSKEIEIKPAHGPIVSKIEPLDLSFEKWDGRVLRLQEGMWDKDLLLEKLSAKERLEYKEYSEERIELYKKEVSDYLDSVQQRQDSSNLKNYKINVIVSWDDKTNELNTHEHHHVPVNHQNETNEFILGFDYVFNGYTPDEQMIRNGLLGKRKRPH